MDKNDALGVIRDVMKVVGGVLLAHGVVSDGEWQIYTGLATAIAPIVWSQLARWQSQAALQDAAATGVAKKPAMLGALTPQNGNGEKHPC